MYRQKCFAFAWTVTQVPWHLCLNDQVEKGMTRYLVTKIMKTPEALKKLLSYIAIGIGIGEAKRLFSASNLPHNSWKGEGKALGCIIFLFGT